VGHLGLAQKNPDVLPFEVMNSALGGNFSSRINMNLREDKGYTYGARTMTINFAQTGIFMAWSQVHTQYTKESLVEFFKELNDIGGTRPLSAEELANSKSRLTQGFPQNFQTIDGIAGQMVDLVLYDMPLDEWQTYMTRVEGADAATIERVVGEYIHPDDMQVIIIGDWEKIESGVRELNLGEITFVEASEL
jgi:zinc protease